MEKLWKGIAVAGIWLGAGWMSSSTNLPWLVVVILAVAVAITVIVVGAQ